MYPQIQYNTFYDATKTMKLGPGVYEILASP